MVNCAAYGLILSLVLLVSAQDQDSNVGGFYAAPGQLPYQASLQVNEQHTCGAAIISDRWLLTSAKCITGTDKVSSYSVLVGTNDLKRPNKFMARYSVETLLPSDLYNGTTANDIGLVKTKTQIRFNSFVLAVPMSGLYVPASVDVSYSGWGLNNNQGNSSLLKFLNVETISNKACNSTGVGNVAQDDMCTVKPYQRDICFGDSGSPLTHRDILVGVGSWIMPCGKSFPDGFARVSSHLLWIRNYVANVTVYY